MSQPDLTYIVSAWNRPKLLPICLHSLAVQTHENFEVIVADNAINEDSRAKHIQIVKDMGDDRFRHIDTRAAGAGMDCYESSQWVIANEAQGLWVAFPCDDCYYVPDFGRRMLAAAYARGLDMVFCDELIGPEAAGGGAYHVWETTWARTPKPSFIVRKSAFPGWCDRPRADVPVACDFVLGQTMHGDKQGKLAECLVAHN